MKQFILRQLFHCAWITLFCFSVDGLKDSWYYFTIVFIVGSMFHHVDDWIQDKLKEYSNETI